MASLKFRSPVTKPVLRAGTPKPVPPDPRAHDTFRVTQRFGTPDSYYAEIDIRMGRTPRTHGAVDLGNYRCGDPVVAMAPGIVRRVKDNATALGAISDALGVVIDHGGGISSEYWHLNAYAGPASGHIAAGTQIGIVGRTGLGNVCHLHVEVKRNGQKIDPEPLIFGGSLEIGGEDDMPLPTDAGYFVDATVGAGVRLRADHGSTAGSFVTDVATAVRVLAIRRDLTSYTVTVNGKPVTDNDWYLVMTVDGKVWHAAKLLVHDIRPSSWLFSQVPMPAADCSAKDAEIARMATKIRNAKTANAGAQQAQNAVAEALK